MAAASAIAGIAANSAELDVVLNNAEMGLFSMVTVVLEAQNAPYGTY